MPGKGRKFTSETGSIMGKRKLNKKHFSTQILESIGKRSKDISDLYISCLERQHEILREAKGRRFTSEEIKEFDALSKITNKALDKLVPNLQESDIKMNRQITKIEIVDLTDTNIQIPQ